MPERRHKIDGETTELYHSTKMKYVLVGCCVVVLLCLQQLVAQGSTFEPLAAATIRNFEQSINFDVDPCDDFYGYVCSEVKKSNLEKADELIKRKIDNIVKRGKQPMDGEAVAKFYDLYSQCERSTEDITDIHVALSVVFYKGQFLWNNHDDKSRARFLSRAAAYANFKMVIDYKMVKPLNKETFKNHEKIMFIDLPMYFRAEDPFNADDALQNRKNNMEKVYKLTFKNKDQAEIDNDVTFMSIYEVDLLTNITRHRLSTPERGIELTVRQAMYSFPGLDWKIYVQTLFEISGMKQPANLDDYILYFVHPALTTIVLNAFSKPDRQFKTYFELKSYVYTTEDLTNKESSDILCDKFVQKTFPLIKQHLYIMETYPTAAKRKQLISSASKFANKLFASLNSVVEKSTWIRNDSKAYASFKEKMAALQKVIAFPYELTDESWLDDQHKDFVKKTVYLRDMYINAKTHVTKSELQLNEYYSRDFTVPKVEWLLNYNLFMLNVGALHETLFNQDNIPAVNYGGLGHLIGRAIIHGFDTDGVNIDSEGFQAELMGETAKQTFDSMAQCVIDEYSKFKFTDSKGNLRYVNGNRTVAENIADIGGLQLAYNAFIKDPASRQQIPQIGKLKGITQKQLFFMSFARNYCGSNTVDGEAHGTFGNKHIPNHLRIFGTLRNFAPFREAFECPIGSKYAPKKHCDVYATP